ncbi:Rieske 2Fe-2S domain-containing protein, partial [Sphingobium sp.]|uniref:Rieske 2Fe-2S domain-containing protein n=1 Tax=Sphingobium sp. TaxID=1912891 RepID=UPI002BDE8429
MSDIDIQDAPARRIGIDASKAAEPALGDAPINPSRYFDRDFWKREWEGMWTKTWQVVALEEQLRKVGDYVTMEFGQEVILAVRGKDENIRCFYNVCPHRGMMLV